MANTKLSGLTAASATADADLFYTAQGGTSKKATALQLKTYCSASPTLVTPTLGVAAGTSLALGGAALPANGVLAVKSTANNASDFAVFNTAGNGAAALGHDGGGAAAISLADNGNNTNVSLTSNTTITSFIKGVFNTSSGVSTPAGGSSSAVLLFGTTAGFGIYYGSNAPTVSAGQGSIYLRSDGSGISNRLYVNTTGSTTWTNFVTAA